MTIFEYIISLVTFNTSRWNNYRGVGYSAIYDMFMYKRSILLYCFFYFKQCTLLYKCFEDKDKWFAEVC